MKKVLLAITLLVLISLLVVPASAVSGSVSLAPSASALSRGDTFTVTATLNTADAINLCTVVLSYDESALELVGGSCQVSGANPAQVIPAQKVGTLFVASPTVINGTVFVFNFKVKDGAAYGSYSISARAAIGTSTGENIPASGASVAVVCNHQYSDWTESGDGHQQSCSVCGDVKTGNHSWDNGTPIKTANCKEGGQNRHTCLDCGATKIQDTPATDAHKYGSWTEINDSTHKRICSVCQKEESQNHVWDEGKITEKATCKKPGQKVRKCTVCASTETEVIPQSTTHTYDHDCDTDCNVCGLTRTTTHNYKTTWSKDKTNHWHECAVCKDKKDVEAHTPGAEATETKAQTCTTCGYVIKAAPGHTHEYATVWTTDENGHWHSCAGCEEKGNYTDHDFENACDEDCSVCGYTREADHVYPEEWNSDATNHWHECTGCGLKQGEDAHTPGEEATATTAQTCTVCDYEIAPALGEEETTEPADQVEKDPDSIEKDPNNGIVIGMVIAAIVVTGGVIAALIMVKKKKQ